MESFAPPPPAAPNRSITGPPSARATLNA